MSLGFAPSDLILALLLVQFVGFPAALGFGRLAGRVGVRRCIYLAICVYCGITALGILMTAKYQFYLLAVAIGLVQGGIQSLSRSYYSRLIPPDQAAEYYGFYNMLGKFAAIIGPTLMGTVALVARRALMPPQPSAAELVAVGRLATRWSLGSVVLLFAVGAVLFHFVDDERGRVEAARLARD
jgi:UMF1 family MFS transporter